MTVHVAKPDDPAERPVCPEDTVENNGVTQKLKNYSLSASEYHDKLIDKGLYEDGTENPDPTPIEPPLGYVRQPTMVEHIRNMIMSEQLKRDLEAQGIETAEEADDFDVPDELEPQSAYEFEEAFEPAPSPEPAPPEAPAPPPEPAAPGQGASGAGSGSSAST